MKKIIIVVVIVIAGLLLFFGMNKDEEKEIKEVVLRPVTLEIMYKSIDVDGTVEIKNEEKIYVSRSMRIDEVYVDEEDEVKKGDLLIKFDEEDRNNIIREIKMKKIDIENLEYSLAEYMFPVSDIDIKKKESEIEDLKTSMKKYINNKEIAENEKINLDKELVNMEKELKVKNKLYAIEGISQTDLDDFLLEKSKLEQSISQKKWDIDEYQIDIDEVKRKLLVLEEEIKEIRKNYSEDLEKQKNNIERTKNQIETYKIEIESLEEDLEKTVKNIKSPVDGTIIELNAEKNFKVNLEQSLMTIADINSQIITANISSSDIKNIKEGQKVKISSDALGEREKIDGKISKVSSIAKTESGSGYEDIVVEVEVSFDNSLKKLKPGYSVDLEIIVDKKDNALTIPSFALQSERKKSYVFIVNSEGVVEKKQVEKGLTTERKVEVKGLNEGEKVIMNSSSVKEGEKVKVVEKMISKVKERKNSGSGGGMRP